MIHKLKFLCLIIVLFLCQTNSFANAPSTKQIKNELIEITKALNQNSFFFDLIGIAPESNDTLKKIEKIFYFKALAKNSLRKEWNNANVEQKEEFTKTFKDFIKYSFLTLLKQKIVKENVNDAKLIFIGTKKVSKHKAILYCLVKYKKKDSIFNDVKIDFYLYNSGNDHFRVYDATIDGVTVSSSYREQFQEFLKDHSLTELINALNDQLVIMKDSFKYSNGK